MTDIRWVCISDLHLGEEDSLLTNLKAASTDTDPTSASPVLVALAECLKALVRGNAGQRKPTLVLAGDALELALANDNQAMMAFERFVEAVLPPPPGERLFDDIIYIPGNHDHHLWELARETQYVNHLKTLAPRSHLPVPWHTTNMLAPEATALPPSYTLTGVVQRYAHLREMVVRTAYPSFGLFDAASRRCVVFSHGHYAESLYHLMTRLTDLVFPDRIRPATVWDVETENFAWIDFFWSTMGRSGDVGEDVELIYEKLGDPEQLKRLLASLASGLAAKLDLPGWGDEMEAALLRWAFAAVVKRVCGTERTKNAGPLTEDAAQGLRAFLAGPLRAQLQSELKGEMPSDVTFVFGHTHKPFQEDMDFPGYPRWVHVYNTGGWVVETVAPEPLHGGAVVLVDEELNTASLRMYNECAEPGGTAVSLEEASHPGAPHNPLFDRLRQLVDPAERPWRELSAAVAEGVRTRAGNLAGRIAEPD
ncbi:MAG: hypothetical protein M0R80_25615 [Proteobacteria bacterium]|jgi:hypothetical protein|nr:hypothetical protein [Pseudomonadota bacterium]